MMDMAMPHTTQDLYPHKLQPQYTQIRELANAIFGRVLLCVDNYTQTPVAIKCMNMQASQAKLSLLDNIVVNEDVAMEKQVLRTLSADGGHPNVLCLLNDFQHAGHDFLVLEYCAQGELFDVVSAQDRLALPAAQTFLRQVASGLQYMHSHGYAHCDLSLENVLVDVAGQAKLCDFGLAASLYEWKTGGVGKPFYMAPEMYTLQFYAPGAADVWSLGMMLFIMVTGSPLVQKAHSSDPTFRFIQTFGLRAIVSAWRMESLFSAEALDLLCRMLDPNPLTRMTLDEVLVHDFVYEDIPLPPVDDDVFGWMDTFLRSKKNPSMLS
ncbi:CAMK protein kinase [Aphanomyces astaci]|nr:CAMK protein kinase [Aphanomyces astaci]ETV82594.1 CAMK protein kinase [Aphanomyces astaci]|eukprot:XP_009828263.1 CAMK protein kinase [Aphanomyces astaci]